MMQVWLCEDDPIFRTSIESKISNWSKANHNFDLSITTFRSSEDLLEHWQLGNHADIFFLDIQIPKELSGLELAKLIRQTDEDVPIVFVTNYAEYVYQGYTVNALRYLKKPVLESDISPCLDIAYKHYTLCHQESSIIAIPGEQIVLQYAEILYLEACSPNLIIKRIGSSSDISFRYRISKVYPLLPSELFAFCHRSYIVNLSKIRILKRTQLVLCSNEVLPISEKYVDELFHKSILFSSAIGVSTHFFNTIFLQHLALLSTPGLYRAIYVVASNLILSIVIFSASKIRKDIFGLSWSVMFVFLFMSLSILVSEECLYQLQIRTHFNSYIFSIGYLGLLICSILSILLFHFMAESTNQENQYKTELNAIRLSQKYQEEFTSIYNDFMIKEHDFKHQLETLKALISENNNTEAQNYLNSYTSQLQNIRPFMTGCLAVDALLTSKALTMKSKNIDFKFTPYPLNSLPLSAPDFCSVVGNLLDNAIEGTQRVRSSDSPFISLAFARTYDVFHIVCKNTCNPKTIRFVNHSWLSSKTNDSHSEIHGVGIHSIERIINNAQGYSSFSVDGCTFVAELTIPFLDLNN